MGLFSRKAPEPAKVAEYRAMPPGRTVTPEQERINRDEVEREVWPPTAPNGKAGRQSRLEIPGTDRGRIRNRSPRPLPRSSQRGTVRGPGAPRRWSAPFGTPPGFCPTKDEEGTKMWRTLTALVLISGFALGLRVDATAHADPQGNFGDCVTHDLVTPGIDGDYIVTGPGFYGPWAPGEVFDHGTTVPHAEGRLPFDTIVTCSVE